MDNIEDSLSLVTNQLDRITIDPIRTFSYLKDKKFTSFIKHSNKIEFYYHEERIWRKNKKNEYKCVCKFIFNDNKFCTNFDIYNGYCRFHKEGIIQKIKSAVDIGDESEQYITNIFLESNDFVNVKCIGNEGGKLDIIFQVKEELDKGINNYRGVQIKTISTRNLRHPDYLYLPLNKKYLSSTLMVGVNEEKNKMCLIFYGHINKNDSVCLPLHFNKVSPILFVENQINPLTNMTFTEQLFYMAKQSSIFDGGLSLSCLQEKNYYNKLKDQCIIKNISCEQYHTSDSDIDIIVNGMKVQCKTSSVELSKGLNYYNIYHKINSQHVPYEEKIINVYFFFMPTNCETFCVYIIPKDILIYLGFLSSSKNKGKTMISIPNDLFKGFHMFSQFKDRYDLLFRPDWKWNEFKYFEDDIVSRFEFTSQQNGLVFEKNNSNILVKCGELNGKLLNFCYSSKEYQTRSGINTQFLVSKPYKTFDKSCYDFYVFENESQHCLFLILSKEILIYYGFIDVNQNVIKKTLTIPSIKTIKYDQWYYPYINNFNQLM